MGEFMNKLFNVFSITTLSMVIGFSSYDLKAQEASKSSALVEEVITTARKKEENQQVVPISISTVSSEQIIKKIILKWKVISHASNNFFIRYLFV